MDTGWIHKLKLRLPSLVLLCLTLWFWGRYDRYEAVAPPLLEYPDIEDAFHIRGEASQSNGVVRLHVPVDGKQAEVRFRIAEHPGFPMVRLSGRIRCEDVVRGKRGWNAARLLLIQRDGQGKWIPGTHGLLDEEGTVAWTGQQQDFEVFPDAAYVEVVLQQTGKSGTAWFEEVLAVPVQFKSSYPVFRLIFGIAWLGMGVLYYKRCRLHNRKLRILILLNCMLILYGTLIPTAWIQQPVDRFVEYLEQVSESRAAQDMPAKPAEVKGEVKPIEKKADAGISGGFVEVVEQSHKIGHYVLFAMLCYLVYCSAMLEQQNRSYYFKVAFDILLFAAVSESLQYLTSDRTPGFSDWMMDVYGMLTALILFLLTRFGYLKYVNIPKA